MKMRILYTLFFFLLLLQICDISARSTWQKLRKFGNLLGPVKFVFEYVEFIRGAVNMAEDLSDPNTFWNDDNDEVLERFVIINDGLDVIAKNQDIMKEELAAIITMVTNISQTFRNELDYHDFYNYVQDINFKLDLMNSYVKHESRFENTTLADFAESIVTHAGNSVTSIAQKTYGLVIMSTNEKNGLFDMLLTQENSLCRSLKPSEALPKLSPVAIDLVWAQLTSQVLIAYAYHIKRKLEKRKYRAELRNANLRFKERMNGIIETVRSCLAPSDTLEFWRCDPSRHIKDETYVEITRLIQGVILNEVQLNPNGQCYQTCESYQNIKHTTIKCEEDSWCLRQHIDSGTMRNCQKLASPINVCESNELKNESIRYHNLYTASGPYRKGKCFGRETNLISRTQYLVTTCDYCLCFFDNEGLHSDRYINLRVSRSNIAKHMVVTGLRFVKHNSIIHLQIQEGQVLPYGHINKTSVGWVPVENYYITDQTIFDGQDYHTFTFNERIIDLDDIEANPGHLITGVRFIKVYGRIKLQILNTRFDNQTGKLDERSSFHKSTPRINRLMRSRVNVDHSDRPTFANSSSKPILHAPQYVKLTNSDERLDAAQSTVPFFDAQPIEFTIPMAVTGVGIFVKREKNSGGFITPKIIANNVKNHMEAALPTIPYH